MASIYKRKKYAPLPPNAVVEEINRRGRTVRVATWVDADGVSRRAEVDHDPRHGERMVVGEARKWTIAYESERGREYRTGYTDRAATQALADRLEKEAARRTEGLI